MVIVILKYINVHVGVKIRQYTWEKWELILMNAECDGVMIAS